MTGELVINVYPYLDKPVFINLAANAAMQPADPALHLLPEPTPVGSFLIKTASTFK
jgi:hypothetical protein